MNSTENLTGEILFAWLHVICTPLLFLGPLHPFTLERFGLARDPVF
jgi:hypothetical protein